MASSGTFPSGELFCTTGETMSDISRQQNKRSSINGCHSNISLLESFLKYNSWFHYISILRTTFYNQNKFERYDSLGDIHHMNIDFIWKTYFRLTSNRMYLMQCNVGYMGLVAAAINNPVLATCNWSLRYNNKIHSNKTVPPDDSVGWRGSFWKASLKLCSPFNKSPHCVRAEGLRCLVRISWALKKKSWILGWRSRILRRKAPVVQSWGRLLPANVSPMSSNSDSLILIIL